MVRKCTACLSSAIALAPAILLAGCVVPPPASQMRPAPVFSAARFFDGATEGQGSLRVIMRRRSAVHVGGQGHVEPDGTLVLDQRVEQAGKPAKTRQWRIREASPGRYTGTLSDATGPVTGETRGNRLFLRFAIKGGFTVRQWLTLAGDGQSAANVMIVSKLGVKVARLDELIRRMATRPD